MAFLQQSTDPVLPVFYNIDANVGKSCPNRPEDAALVSFLMVRWLERHPDLIIQSLSARTPIGGYSTALQDLIDAAQEALREEQSAAKKDGYITRAAPNIRYNHGRASYMICMANYHVAKYYLDVWPRIDKIFGCPSSVTSLVDRTVLVSAR